MSADSTTPVGALTEEEIAQINEAMESHTQCFLERDEGQVRLIHRGASTLRMQQTIIELHQQRPVDHAWVVAELLMNLNREPVHGPRALRNAVSEEGLCE